MLFNLRNSRRRCNRFSSEERYWDVRVSAGRENDLSIYLSIDRLTDRDDDPGLFMRAAIRFINSLDRLSAQPISLQTASVLL